MESEPPMGAGGAVLAPLSILLLPLLLLPALACEHESPRGLECGSPDRVARIESVHYEGLDCDGAIRLAESRLTTAYYRKACEQLAPEGGVPARVEDAYVSQCRPADDELGGSLLDVALCCPR